ncbi:MAG: LysR family transcriptional regulator [Pseudomonadota bacterium]
MPMRPSPQQLAAFTEAARHRSFSAAARAMGRTQSAITQHVAKLESLVGAQLFIRQRDGLELTRAGRNLFELTDQLRNIEEIVHDRIARFGALSSGSLRIIANAPRPALHYIAAFSQAHPGIEINLRLGTWDEVRESLADRGSDLAFLTDPPTGHDLASLSLGNVGYRAFLLADHPLARLDRVDLSELRTETVVVPEDGSLTQRAVLGAFAAARLPYPRLLKAGTFPLVKEAVLHGAGVGIMLEDCVLGDPRLVDMPLVQMQRRYEIALMTQPERRNLRLVASFFASCAEHLKSADMPA